MESRTYSLVIKGRLDGSLKTKNNGCKFLKETKDVFRCAANDLKSRVCRSFHLQ